MASEQSNVIIFGGGFNPPTIAHQEIMGQCLALPGFDELWIMPSGDRRDKKVNTADSNVLTMLNLVVEAEFDNDPRLKVSDFELRLPRPAQTYQTIGKLAAAYSNVGFWFTFGSDSYRSMPSWNHGKELQDNLNMIIIERNGDSDIKNENVIHLRINKGMDLSSTYSRNAAAAGKLTTSIVCAPVLDFIHANKLYS